MHLDTLLMAGGALYFLLFNDVLGILAVAGGVALHLYMSGAIA